MRRLLWLAVGAYVGRWAALELASLAGRRWLPPSPPSKDSPRQPGLLPAPHDSSPSR